MENTYMYTCLIRSANLLFIRCPVSPTGAMYKFFALQTAFYWKRRHLGCGKSIADILRIVEGNLPTRVQDHAAESLQTTVAALLIKLF